MKVEFSKKTLIVLSSGSIVALILLAISVFFVNNTVFRFDYEDFAKESSAITARYNTAVEVSGDYLTQAMTANTTEKSLNLSGKKFDESLSNYNQALKTAGKAKALKNPKVNTAYDNLLDKSIGFEANNQLIKKLAQPIHQVAIGCSESNIGKMETSDLGRVLEQYDLAVDGCVKATQQFKDIDNQYVAKYYNNATEYFASLRQSVEAMQTNYLAKNRRGFETEYNKFLDKSNQFSVNLSTSTLINQILNNNNDTAKALENLTNKVRASYK